MSSGSGGTFEWPHYFEKSLRQPTYNVGTGGGLSLGTGETKMSDGPSREEIDAKLGKVAAETDTKIARIEGKLDLVLAKLDTSIQGNAETREVVRSEQSSTRANLWVVAIGLAAIIIAAIVAMPTFFSLGMQVRDTAAQAAIEQFNRMKPPPVTPHH